MPATSIASTMVKGTHSALGSVMSASSAATTLRRDRVAARRNSFVALTVHGVHENHGRSGGALDRRSCCLVSNVLDETEQCARWHTSLSQSRDSLSTHVLEGVLEPETLVDRDTICMC